MLENRQLQTFIQTAEEGSFSKAARKAYVSPTALIQQINLLEKRLKTKLFLRSHQGLTLTKAGRSFYKDAKYILQYMQDAVARAQQAAREDVPPVRLGTSLMTPSQFLLGLWPDIQKKDPELNIRLVPFDNTPENAKEILSRLGQHIDVVAGPIRRRLQGDLRLRHAGAFPRAGARGGFAPSSAGRQRYFTAAGFVRAEIPAA